MKYIANLTLKRNVFPKDYRRTVISFFKKAISEYMSGYFFDEYYNSGSNSKDLVWSIRFIGPKFMKDDIELESVDVEITLKIPDEKTALVYFSALLNYKNKPFNIGNDNQLTLKKIRMVEEKKIISNTVEFKILSPICIRLHDEDTNFDTYVTVKDEKFKEEFIKKLKEDMDYLDKEIDELIFDFENLKTTVVLAYGQMIPVTLGTFIAKGDERVLTRMAEAGVCSRRNSGFGLVEVIRC